ncbi:MAG: hypothetical protein PHH26_00290 [Candidatus Thermoplasmatota archaeon]|nr:hypothetical protein [Candidatus Thermoplasmatota archaeon]
MPENRCISCGSTDTKKERPTPNGAFVLTCKTCGNVHTSWR